jgi:hypothetical protein
MSQTNEAHESAHKLPPGLKRPKQDAGSSAERVMVPAIEMITRENELRFERDRWMQKYETERNKITNLIRDLASARENNEAARLALRESEDLVAKLRGDITRTHMENHRLDVALKVSEGVRGELVKLLRHTLELSGRDKVSGE